MTTRIPIFKSRDAENVRVYADEVRSGVWRFTVRHGQVSASSYELTGDEAQRTLAGYRAADAMAFMNAYSVGA